MEMNQVEDILAEIKKSLPSTDSEVITTPPPTPATPYKKAKNHNQSSNVTVLSRPSTPAEGYNVTIVSIDPKKAYHTKSLPPKSPTKLKRVSTFCVCEVL